MITSTLTKVLQDKKNITVGMSHADKHYMECMYICTSSESFQNHREFYVYIK